MTTDSTAARYVQPYRYALQNIPLAAIRRFACQIAERFHPDKIILFGSYIYPQPIHLSKNFYEPTYISRYGFSST